MSKIQYIFVLVLLLAGQARADEWAWKDTAWESGFTIAAIGDWIQTDHIADCPDNPPVLSSKCPFGYHEIKIQRIIGIHPSRASVNEYFTAVIIGHAVISNYLPIEYKVFNWNLNLRRIWQVTTFTIEVDVVHKNYQVGIGFDF